MTSWASTMALSLPSLSSTCCRAFCSTYSARSIILLAEYVEQKARQHVEDRDGSDNAIVDAHDVIGDPEQIKAHHPVLVLDQKSADENVFFPGADERKDRDRDQPDAH